MCIRDSFGIDINVPVRSLPPEHLDILLYGVGNERFKFGYHNFAGDWVLREAGYDGLIPYLERKYNEVRTQGVRDEIEDFITTRTCPSCKGARLRPVSYTHLADFLQNLRCNSALSLC